MQRYLNTYVLEANLYNLHCYQGASGAGNFTCDIGEPLPNGRALILGGGSFTLHNGTSPVKGKYSFKMSLYDLRKCKKR